eukprot:60641_1
MFRLIFIATITINISIIFATWQLDTQYQGDTFFNDWDFFTGSDPTHGFVNYTDRNYATAKGYISHSSSATNVYIGCDHTTVAQNSGRNSVRISTKKRWNTGLFIIELTHMPQGCGTWPAWWLLGDCAWPQCGEIDVIEGVNDNVNDQTSLHTSNGCDFSGININASTNMNGLNCYTDYATNNDGCSFTIGDNSYGSALNSVGGGVYALEWTKNGLSSWWWKMSDVPSNVKSMNPNPTTWGLPYANWPFGSWCPSTKLKDMYIIFDLTFCGDWAGGVWGSYCSNQVKDSSCQHYVQNNPSSFVNAYWIIDYVRVFQQN